ncbi:hypothetical protein AbraIFM66950_004724 [Aspergillus brasiliensis]|nr:hypothetical protein AbraIFM66950_004724 [Aspergillus brasiliensis]
MFPPVMLVPQQAAPIVTSTLPSAYHNLVQSPQYGMHQAATLASNSTYNVSESQFLSWNPNILGSCDGVANGQRVCLQAPGGTWATPPVAITAPTGTSAYYTTAIPAYPTQNGTTSDCGKYYQVSTGDDCATVDLRFGLNFTTLQSLNTFLTETCSNLWLGYDVCVATVSTPVVSTDGSCGLGVTCTGSTFGSCCSSAGTCTDDCGSVGNGTISTNGLCGPDNNYMTCPGSEFGDCCSTPASAAPATAMQEAVPQTTEAHL